MTDIAIAASPRLPLGIGSIIGDIFSIFFRRFLVIVFISLIPNAIGILLKRNRDTSDRMVRRV